jgi:tetratricopeptide (TPR) repeat protein
MATSKPSVSIPGSRHMLGSVPMPRRTSILRSILRFRSMSLFVCVPMYISAPAWSREAASPMACQTAATQPAIANAKAALDSNPNDLRANFKLADAWSDAGCFNEAMQVLQNAKNQLPGNEELETRLRVARSLVGEEHFFDNLDRVNDEAKFKRDIFRCSTLSDLEACSEAARLKADDPAVLIAQGDALMREKRPADALSRYRRAAALAPNQPDVATKISAVEAQLAATPPSPASASNDASDQPYPAGSRHRTAPALRVASNGATPGRRYSNAAPEAHTH